MFQLQEITRGIILVVRPAGVVMVVSTHVEKKHNISLPVNPSADDLRVRAASVAHRILHWSPTNLTERAHRTLGHGVLDGSES